MEEGIIILRIGFLCKDTELISKFKLIEHYSISKVGENIYDFNETDVLLVSDIIINTNELLQYRESNENVKYVFYMVSNENATAGLSSVLKAQNIMMVPPKLTKKQIVELVCQNTLEDIKTHKNIVTFFGADSKVGTTMVAQCVAKRIAAMTSLKVCLMFLNGKPSLEYLESSTTLGLDSIKLSLANQMLSMDDFMSTCIKQDNLYILQGPEAIEGMRYYHPDYIEYLLETICDFFDIVIVDAGSCMNISVELGMSIAALNSTHFRFLIATQQESVFNQYLRVKQQVLDKLHISDFMLIVNKLVENDMLSVPYEVGNLFNCTVVGSLPFLEWGWQCEKSKKTLLEFGDKKYRRDLDKIITLISDQLQFHYAPDDKNSKSSIFQKILSLAR